tara:strand:+ start:299 stop:463 length:165 start_codon:yes stop_codon:yes gene_type:complete
MGRKNKGLNANDKTGGRRDNSPVFACLNGVSGRAKKRLLKRMKRILKKKGNVKL